MNDGAARLEIDPNVAATHAQRDGPGDSGRRQQGIWLLACAALVFAMVVLGGVTRLTGSGLSMVDWEPVSGVLPPLGEAAWAEEFTRYQASPEFRKVNYWMTVADFKRIFWLEWGHRLLGRTIGLAFLAPFVYFLARRQVAREQVPKYVTLFVLGGLQGLLGWYMVKSGLVDDPHVSQYRLTSHLAAAVVIYVYMLWVALDLLRPGTSRAGPARGAGLATGVTALAVLTVLSGGFVAGLKAGLTFNTFPMMGERWIPQGLYAMSPPWLNWFENVATVQFNHRVLAVVTLVAVVALWARGLRDTVPAGARPWLHLSGLAVVLQVALGISTLLMRVPVALGAAHQAGALVLVTMLVVLVHHLRHPVA